MAAAVNRLQASASRPAPLSGAITIGYSTTAIGDAGTVVVGNSQYVELAPSHWQLPNTRNGN